MFWSLATCRRSFFFVVSTIWLLLIGPAEVWASHNLGTAKDIVPFPVGPGGGVVTYSEPGALFLILRFTAEPGSAGDQVRVLRPLGDDDVLDLVPGQIVWSRPVPGDMVSIEYLDDGDGIGGAVLGRTGSGESIDLFQLNGFTEPMFSPNGLCGTNPDWGEVACLSDSDPTESLVKTVAESVGMLVMVHGDKVTSCTATLIDADLLLTSGHCVAPWNLPMDEVVATSSFTFDFEAGNCAGSPPSPNNPRFFKVRDVVRLGFANPANLDYAVVQIDTSPAGPGGLGVDPIPFRSGGTPPGFGTSLFVVHHPRGSRKKVSRQPPNVTCTLSASSATKVVPFQCDVDNGSSGSSLVDTNGEIVGVMNWAADCHNQAQSTVAILPDLLSPQPLAADVDTMVVFDKSGSMNLPAPGGGTKLEEAQEAAKLFFDLMRTDASHQAGLVTFHHAVTTDHDLAPMTPGAKDVLIRETPPGKVESIVASGMTSIGGGLERAQERLDLLGGENTPTILLMTDGLQNASPMIDDIEEQLEGTRLCAVGFGTEASLDGPRLTQLAQDHGGLYTRADSGLDLRKFFALCFGDIFESGISKDPVYHMHAGVTESEEIPIPVCGEEDLTVVVAWEDPQSLLVPRLTTPGGVTVDASTTGVVASSGLTWSYLRFPLPLWGERDGTWTLQVHRPTGTREQPRPLDHEDFAIVSIVDGGPRLRAVHGSRLYTGDILEPRVTLRDLEGRLYDAEVAVTVERPDVGPGELLMDAPWEAPITVGGDSLDARTSSLLALEEESSEPLISRSKLDLILLDDGLQDEGAIERDGQYGARVPDLLIHEGSYTFHARADFPSGSCVGRRETFWSTHVDVGVDPGRTGVEAQVLDELPDGRWKIRLQFTPQDRYGSHLGPGRLEAFVLEDRPGSEVLGPVGDLLDGSYQVEIAWDPGLGEAPGVLLVQPGRQAADLRAEAP